MTQWISPAKMGAPSKIQMRVTKKVGDNANLFYLELTSAPYSSSRRVIQDASLASHPVDALGHGLSSIPN